MVISMRLLGLALAASALVLALPALAGASAERRLAQLIALLHLSNIRVEALLSSENADQGGKHREKLLERVRGVVEFNQNMRLTRSMEFTWISSHKSEVSPWSSGCLPRGALARRTSQVDGECGYPEQTVEGKPGRA